MRPKAIVALVGGTLFLIVLLQNTQIMYLRFLFWRMDISSVILLPLILLIGIAVGFFFGRETGR